MRGACTQLGEWARAERCTRVHRCVLVVQLVNGQMGRWSLVATSQNMARSAYLDTQLVSWSLVTTLKCGLYVLVSLAINS